MVSFSLDLVPVTQCIFSQLSKCFWDNLSLPSILEPCIGYSTALTVNPAQKAGKS